ncbi:PPPDE peptidase, putative [Plasmodium chabaudi chabaudi]|uniref:PPPDE peptidase, putative n=1 Tax=Plasmodium chabaudi chabaudi TaxID=31271 RepID=A0A1D3S034_PLACU|nr:PPPDE peptidase, putative [Plasmodium chabaudi chabaudi]SCN61765.1 PPPDE peptidase, putative [Plasmodium chabaudi chabaudi]VTZ69529.1 PPPDE peptidase, putative [Plasmodium chabaudi chabaudi]
MQSKENLGSRESISSDNNGSGPSETKQSPTRHKYEANSSMVYLNIYDLDPVSKVVNSVVKSIGTGAFHAGVEVYGFEYSFGYIPGGQTGVMKTLPRHHPYHVYRESIPMGQTPLTRSEVDLLVDVMRLQWIGNTYDILSRQDIMKKYIKKSFQYHKNCLNFADYFCNLLDVGSIPEWVMSLQKNLNWMKSNISMASSKLKELNKASGLPNVLNYVKKKYNKSDESPKKCKVVLK